MNDRQQELLDSGLLVGGATAVLLLTIIVFLTPEAQEYEFSIYRGYPMLFWGLVLFGIFSGQLVILRAALTDRTDFRSWPLGVVIIMAVEAVLFLLPYFRGYQAYDRADVLTHVGFIRNIHSLGALPPSDIYPNIHLLTLSFSYVTGIDPLQIINSISVIIPLFSVLAWYVLVTWLYDGRRALLTLPFALLLVAGGAYVNPSPFTQSSLLVPFVLYVFFRERRTRSLQSRAVLLIVLVAVVIYHPLTTAFLILGLIAYFVANHIGSLTPSVDTISPWRGSTGKGVTIQLMVALFFSWYYTFEPILNRSREAIQGLLGTSSGGSELDKYSSVVSETSPQLSDILVIGFAKYGLSGVLMGIGGLYLLLIAYDTLTDMPEISEYELSFSLSFIGFLGLAVLFLVFNLIAGFGRPLIYVNIFAVLLSGSLFYKLYQRYEMRHLVTGFLCLLLLSHTVFGVVTLYHSPLAAETSRQVTDKELEGSQWLLDNRNRYTKTVEYGISFYRFSDAYHGKNKSSRREVIDPSSPRPPDHFSYDRNATLGPSYDSDRYMIITKKGREFYQEMYPEYEDQWRFRPADYDKLQNDPTVGQLYDNGEVRIYRITATGGITQ
ncbi:hypothetical protein SG26_17275 (plasmid) [Haloarcula sp. CBA1115]|uniref:hypothetical protein n=1 Tax=Haloarcula TaxID=2237 RepID=UPI0005955813|nr:MULTISPECIES: hypothetical protein [Haloarcula]AJF27529.1 hypothetical protein SG26_17275 [Haloarcula sp. CBA1115]KAA9404504.1 hypothetical protein Har1131_17145 [Haloarcula sp. CBA1131]